jgi:hypothetical protein
MAGHSPQQCRRKGHLVRWEHQVSKRWRFLAPLQGLARGHFWTTRVDIIWPRANAVTLITVSHQAQLNPDSELPSCIMSVLAFTDLQGGHHMQGRGGLQYHCRPTIEGSQRRKPFSADLGMFGLPYWRQYASIVLYTHPERPRGGAR